MQVHGLTFIITPRPKLCKEKNTRCFSRGHTDTDARMRTDRDQQIARSLPIRRAQRVKRTPCFNANMSAMWPLSHPTHLKKDPKPAPECMQPMLARAERRHPGASGMHQMSGAGRHDLRSGLWVSAKHVIRAVLNRIKTRDPSSRDIWEHVTHDLKSFFFFFFKAEKKERQTHRRDTIHALEKHNPRSERRKKEEEKENKKTPVLE